MTQFVEQNISVPKAKAGVSIDNTEFSALGINSFIRQDVVKKLTPQEELQIKLDQEKKDIEAEKLVLQQEKENLKNLAELLKKGIEETNFEKERWFQDVKVKLKQTVMLISEKVIENELKTQPEVIINCIESILKEVHEENKDLYLNSEDYKLLEEKCSEILTTLNSVSQLTIHQSSSLPSGNIVVETSCLRLDGSFPKKLETIWNELNCGHIAVSQADLIKEEEHNEANLETEAQPSDDLNPTSEETSEGGDTE